MCLKYSFRTSAASYEAFLTCAQSFYYDEKPLLSNEEFDNLKEELLWGGSKVAILRYALVLDSLLIG